MKEKRNISGIWFRYKNPETNKIENRVFEDFPEEDQSKLIETMNEKFLKGMVKSLANSLNEIGEQFNIIAE